MSGRKSSFETLDCWKEARALKIFIRKEIRPKLPKHEQFDLADQLRRAARSITANIAEGYGRYHYLDEAKFLSNARGSAHEVLDHLIDACDEGYITDQLLTDSQKQLDEVLKLINGYRAYIIRRSKE